MISYRVDNVRFNYRIAGVCIHNGSVLLHKTITDDFWALPGGRAELLEYSTDTLRREMTEELDVEVNVGRLLWISERFLELDGVSIHELSMYYLFDFPADHTYYSLSEFNGIEEGTHLLFRWYPIEELSDTRLVPKFLRKSLSNLPTEIVHLLHSELFCR